MNTKPTAIFDIDGTLANVDHRLHHIIKSEPEWDKFFSESWKDQPYPNMIKILKERFSEGWEIIFMTGRPERTRKSTRNWLRKHGITGGKLYMRPDDDQISPDYVLKKKWLQELEAINDKRRETTGNRNKHPAKMEIIEAYDDRQHNVDMFKEAGIKKVINPDIFNKACRFNNLAFAGKGEIGICTAIPGSYPILPGDCPCSDYEIYK